MVLITEDLIRKRAEHNECIISTLEEVSLHQQDIERIEYLDKWCRELKILYLQSNLISKIENVGRLKKLEYLNLALNNIERVENLEGCESLKKLDFTVNFIGELTSIELLRGNYNLKELFLTGNPCTDYEGYREYVISILPQLKSLDGIEIEKSERILALQKLPEIRPLIIQQQRKYQEKRKRQIAEADARERGEPIKEKDDTWYTKTDAQLTSLTEPTSDENDTLNTIQDSTETNENIDEDDTRKKDVDSFWKEKVAFTPESRKEAHEHLQRLRDSDNKKEEEKAEIVPRKLQSEDGRIYNVNEAKIDFSLTENDEEVLVDVAMFRHMDTSLCDVDVQPTYVKVMLKGKILQLVLPAEVKPDSSSAKRSQTTGHLLITMPKLHPIIPKPKTTLMGQNLNQESKDVSKSRNEVLEVDPTIGYALDIGNIVKKEKSFKGQVPLGSREKLTITERPNSEHFVDDDSVPPLI